jgi:HEAT repeat protein
MISPVRRLLLLLLLILAPLEAGAAPGPATPAEIARLIRQLASADFDEREAATQALDAIGLPALDALDVAAAATDPEVRHRAEGLIDAIEHRHYGRVMIWNGKRVADWRRDLASNKAADRIEAAKTLARMSPAAERILPALLPVLAADPDGDVRLEAIRAVASFGPRAVAAVDGLKVALRDPSKTVRLAVAESLWAVDARADLAVPVLTNLLAVGEEDKTLRSQAANDLARMAPYAREAIPALTKTLEEPDLPTRLGLAVALWSIDRQNEAAQGVFLDLLANDPELFRRCESLRYLTRSLPPRKQLVPVFLAALKDPAQVQRMLAPRALRGLDELAPEEVRALLAALDDADMWTRAGVVQTLGEMAPRTPEVIRAVAKVLVEDREATPRRVALHALHQMGPAAREELPALLKATSDPHIRNEALLVVARLGTDAKAGIPALIEMLKDPTLRGGAARALAQIGPDAAPAIPALIAILDDPSPNVPTAEALVRIGPAALEPLLKTLESKSGQVSMQAANTLGKFGAKAVAPLAKIVAEGNGSAPWLAGHALVQIGPEAKPALPELLAALKGNNATLRRSATRAVCKIDPLHEDVFPVLLKLIADRDGSNRFEVIHTLGELGPRAHDALPALTAALKGDLPNSKLQLAEAIARIDPKSPLPLPVFLDALKAPTPFARADAWRTLGRLGKFAELALGQLPEAIADKDWAVRQAAYGVLIELLPLSNEVPPEVVTACGKALRDRGLTPVGDSRVRLAQVLGRMGPRAKPLLGVLTEALRSPDPAIRPAAALALWQIDRSPLSIPALVDVLSRVRDSAIRAAAADALAEIGPEARPALPVLLQAAQSNGGFDTSDLIVRPAAARAVWKIDPKTQAWVLPILLESLRDGSYSEARVQTIQTLGDFGPAARSALPALQRATQAFEESIRVAAAEAIRRIEARP